LKALLIDTHAWAYRLPILSADQVFDEVVTRIW